MSWLRFVVLGFAIVWCAESAWAQRSVPVDVINPKTDPVPTVDPGYRFIGYSDLPISPVTGRGNLNRLCQARFGADARMCTSDEIVHTPGRFDFVSGNRVILGWVEPSVRSVAVLPDGDLLAQTLFGQDEVVRYFSDRPLTGFRHVIELFLRQVLNHT